MTAQEILDLKFESQDLGKTTVRSFFKELLQTLFDEGDGFSGKRPFGNSGWENDLEILFVEQGLVAGEVGEPGYGVTVNQLEYDKLIKRLIGAL